jgi:hypothetical protein
MPNCQIFRTNGLDPDCQPLLSRRSEGSMCTAQVTSDRRAGARTSNALGQIPRVMSWSRLKDKVGRRQSGIILTARSAVPRSGRSIPRTTRTHNALPRQLTTPGVGPIAGYTLVPPLGIPYFYNGIRAMGDIQKIAGAIHWLTPTLREVYLHSSQAASKNAICRAE